MNARDDDMSKSSIALGMSTQPGLAHQSLQGVGGVSGTANQLPAGAKKHKRNTSVIKTISTIKKTIETDKSNMTGMNDSEHTDAGEDTMVTPENLLQTGGDKKRGLFDILNQNKQLLTNPNNETETNAIDANSLMQQKNQIISPKN